MRATSALKTPGMATGCASQAARKRRPGDLDSAIIRDPRFRQCILILLNGIQIAQALKRRINVGKLASFDDPCRHSLEKEEWSQAILFQQSTHGTQHFHTVHGG